MGELLCRCAPATCQQLALNNAVLRVACAEDGELHINCQKTKKGETWPSALKGHGAVRSSQRSDSGGVGLRPHQHAMFAGATTRSWTP